MTSWTDYQDDISDAISDSMDVDWSASVGARAVVAWLNEHRPLMADTPRVTVPVEPTEEMIEAGNRALSPWIAPAMHAAEAYRAMLSAAPAPSSLAGGEVSPLVKRLAYGYAIMHSAICNMAGTSGADGRWYYDKANEAFGRVSPIHSITEESNPHVNGDYFSGLSNFLAALSPEAPARERVTHPDAQPFERFPELALHIERMAMTGLVGSGISWDAFLRELNAALATRDALRVAATDLLAEVDATAARIGWADHGQRERLRRAIATREEAPAEAGDIKHFAASMAEDGALRAQPQAREDAPPLEWKRTPSNHLFGRTIRPEDVDYLEAGSLLRFYSSDPWFDSSGDMPTVGQIVRFTGNVERERFPAVAPHLEAAALDGRVYPGGGWQCHLFQFVSPPDTARALEGGAA